MAELQISPKQPAPLITRTPGVVDGKVVQQVHGNHVYAHARGITEGDTVSGGLIVNGVLQADSVTEPWIATALPGKYPSASVKLLVADNCDSDHYDAPEPEPEP